MSKETKHIHAHPRTYSLTHTHTFDRRGRRKQWQNKKNDVETGVYGPMSIMFDSSQGKGMVGTWIVDAASPVRPGLISLCQACVYINTHVPSLCLSHTGK